MKEEFGIERIPCCYWLLSLLKRIKLESLNKCLMKWAETMLPMVAADALNCQRETAEAIVRGKGGYLLVAKWNQSVLEKEIREYVPDKSLRKTMDCESATEKSRGRRETRTAYTAADVSRLLRKEKWKKLCCIGAIRTQFEKNGTKTEEWHDYISSRNLTVSELLHHTRMEWTGFSMFIFRKTTAALQIAPPNRT